MENVIDFLDSGTTWIPFLLMYAIVLTILFFKNVFALHKAQKRILEQELEKDLLFEQIDSMKKQMGHDYSINI